MLIALCLILAVAVVVLAVLNVKVRARLGEYVAADEQRTRDMDTARAELRDAVAQADEAGRERDEALERVQRSRRDAAEVANRLSETTARTEELAEESRVLTAANRDLESRVTELDEALSEARRKAESVVVVPGSGDAVSSSLDGDVLWGLTLSRIDRRWRVSVAAGVDSTSPLLTSDSLLADAVAIETEAAREEAGVPIELAYEGDGDVDGATAATTVALVEELVAGVIHVADEADLGIEVTDEAVLVSLTATSDGRTVDVPGPADLLDADGRYRIERVAETAVAAE